VKKKATTRIEVIVSIDYNDIHKKQQRSTRQATVSAPATTIRFNSRN